jgi:hypothetical protein
MNCLNCECKNQGDPTTPEKIVLAAGGHYPIDVIFTNERGETKKYRLVKTKFGCLTLNK